MSWIAKMHLALSNAGVLAKSSTLRLDPAECVHTLRTHSLSLSLSHVARTWTRLLRLREE